MATDNIFVRTGKRIAGYIAEQIATYLSPDQVAALKKNREYFLGVQKRPLKLKPGQADDNLVVNLVGLAVNRSNSMLFGGGVDFSVPANPGADAWLRAAWDANKKNIILHRTGIDGELSGTSYMKLIPEGREYRGEVYPRLVLLDPALMAIETDPMDIEQVDCYIFEMHIPGEDRTIREKTRRVRVYDVDGEPVSELFTNENGIQEPAVPGTWIVETWESKGNNAAWILIKSVKWEYPFPPIHHWQNLPAPHSVYGMDGTGGSLDVQDKYNFVISNAMKILRYHAHPKTWARGVKSQSEKVSWGSDEMVKFSDPEAMVANLEMNSDLGSSRAIAQDMRQLVFDLFRVVDIASMKDKVGALTNFGLRVLYSDALSKNATRRELYGDALMEINRRMMMLAAGSEDVPESDVIWGADLPQDEKEDAEMVRLDLQAGIVSRQTAASKRGYEWDTVRNDAGEVVREGEADRIASEAAATRDNEANALARFFTGNETPQ